MSSKLMVWLLMALLFAVITGLVLYAMQFWRTRWGTGAQAMRMRLEDLMGVSTDQNRSERLLRVMSADGKAVWQQRLLEFPGSQKLAQLLQRTQSNQSLGNFIGWVLIILIACFLCMWLLFDKTAPTALGVALVVAAVPWLLKLRVDRRQRKLFEEKFPDALDYLARSLRSGQSLTAGLSLVGQEFDDPLGREFKKTVDEINYGLGFTDAMHNLSQRVRSPDLDFFVVAIVIQRETGGNLADLLMGLSNTVRERMKLAGKIRVISAEGRLSGLVLGSLPFILAGLLTLLNPQYMYLLWTSEGGIRIVAAGLVMMMMGAVWIWKIVRVRV